MYLKAHVNLTAFQMKLLLGMVSPRTYLNWLFIIPPLALETTNIGSIIGEEGGKEIVTVCYSLVQFLGTVTLLNQPVEGDEWQCYTCYTCYSEKWGLFY